MPATPIRQTGKYGNIVLTYPLNGTSQRLRRLTNWSYSESESTQSNAYAGTESYPIVTPVTKQGQGSFSTDGIAALDNGQLIDIGQKVGLVLKKGKYSSNGYITIPKAFLNGMQFSADVSQRQVQTQYSFTPTIEDELDVPTETPASTTVDGWNPRIPGWVDQPMILERESGILVAKDGVYAPGLCIQSLSYQKSATPITVVDTCTEEWVSTIGIGRINGGAQVQVNASDWTWSPLESCLEFALVFTCNVGLQDLQTTWRGQDLQELFPEKFSTEGGTLGCFYPIEGKFFVSQRGPIGADIVGGNIISYNLAGDLTVWCGDCIGSPDAATLVSATVANGTGTLVATLPASITPTPAMFEIDPTYGTVTSVERGTGLNVNVTFTPTAAAESGAKLEATIYAPNVDPYPQSVTIA